MNSFDFLVICIFRLTIKAGSFENRIRQHLNNLRENIESYGGWPLRRIMESLGTWNAVHNYCPFILDEEFLVYLQYVLMQKVNFNTSRSLRNVSTRIIPIPEYTAVIRTLCASSDANFVKKESLLWLRSSKRSSLKVIDTLMHGTPEIVLFLRNSRVVPENEHSNMQNWLIPNWSFDFKLIRGKV